MTCETSQDLNYSLAEIHLGLGTKCRTWDPFRTSFSQKLHWYLHFRALKPDRKWTGQRRPDNGHRTTDTETGRTDTHDFLEPPLHNKPFGQKSVSLIHGRSRRKLKCNNFGSLKRFFWCFCSGPSENGTMQAEASRTATRTLISIFHAFYRF